MIIGAGIVEVHYIEPYPKSLVGRLYGDLIDISPPATAGSGVIANRVPFYQFIGIAPRMYFRAFSAPKRKDGIHFVDFDRSVACPATVNYVENATSEREEAIAVVINYGLRKLVLSLSRDDDS